MAMIAMTTSNSINVKPARADEPEPWRAGADSWAGGFSIKQNDTLD